MEMLLTYRRKPGEWPFTRKILKLPDAPVGVLAFKLDEGRYLEIAQVFEGEVFVSGEVRDDNEALLDALYEFEDDCERRQSKALLKQYEAQLKDCAATNPAPLELVVFARELAADLGINLDDLAKQRADEQLDLLNAAE